jgi:hypothetical protein
VRDLAVVELHRNVEDAAGEQDVDVLDHRREVHARQRLQRDHDDRRRRPPQRTRLAPVSVEW